MDPNGDNQPMRWEVVSAYWTGSRWQTNNYIITGALVSAWRLIEPPPKNRSGFITLHYYGSPVLVRAKHIATIYAASKHGTAYERLGDQAEASRMCDETPEQILALIEEVES